MSAGAEPSSVAGQLHDWLLDNIPEMESANPKAMGIASAALTSVLGGVLAVLLVRAGPVFYEELLEQVRGDIDRLARAHVAAATRPPGMRH